MVDRRPRGLSIYTDVIQDQVVSAEDIVNESIANPFESLVTEDEMAYTAETSPLPILERTSRVAPNNEANREMVNNPETLDRPIETEVSLQTSSNNRFEFEGAPRLRVNPISQIV